MRPVRYNVAASLDGCIAGPEGGFDWIPDEHPDFTLVREDAAVRRSAGRSVAASPAAPSGGVRQREQVQAGEQEQEERRQR